MRARIARFAVPTVLASLAACASVEFVPDGPTSGHFRSSALAFTILGRDMPQSALQLAQANASDSQLPNLLVQEQTVFPYLWRFDFLLDLISVRWAIVRGTWGSPDG